MRLKILLVDADNPYDPISHKNVKHKVINQFLYWCKSPLFDASHPCYGMANKKLSCAN